MIIIPPVVFYVVGVALMLGGLWRAVRLGRAAIPEQSEGEQGAAKVAKAIKDRRRHMIMGIIWIVMGLFMLLSSSGVIPRLLHR